MCVQLMDILPIRLTGIVLACRFLFAVKVTHCFLLKNEGANRRSQHDFEGKEKVTAVIVSVCVLYLPLLFTPPPGFNVICQREMHPDGQI